MTKKMILSLYFSGGGHIEKELYYNGSSEEEIASIIAADENALLEYMRTQDNMGAEAFCFCGFIFKKKSITAAQLSEPPYQESEYE